LRFPGIKQNSLPVALPKESKVGYKVLLQGIRAAKFRGKVNYYASKTGGNTAFVWLKMHEIKENQQLHQELVYFYR